jgi:hypothetical protein
MTRELLDEPTIERLREYFPQLPDLYFDYLRHDGWGDARSGRMIYRGPLEASEVYGDQSQLASVVLLGDDYQGYCLGFDILSGSWLEVDPRGETAPLDPRRAFADFVGRPSAL